MARSADHLARVARTVGAAGVIAAAGAILAGCSTTQQEAARLQLNSARIRASQVPTRVKVAGHTVQVTRMSLVPGASGTAFVVQIRNPGPQAVSDLPISVGVRAGNERRFLNAQSQSEFSYFDAHLPLIEPGATVTWVYETNQHLSARARPFAYVGAVPSVHARPASRPPIIHASVSPSSTQGSAASSRLTIALRNETSIPQYQLQVYAYAQDGNRYVAAGDVTVPHLGSQAHLMAKLPLVGDSATARLQVEALPTIVH